MLMVVLVVVLVVLLMVTQIQFHTLHKVVVIQIKITMRFSTSSHRGQFLTMLKINSHLDERIFDHLQKNVLLSEQCSGRWLELDSSLSCMFRK